MSLYRPDWITKTLAGLIFGFALGIAVSGLFAWLTPSGVFGAPIKFQITMWLVAPVWLITLCAVYLFQRGGQAIIWLGSASVICWALLLACPHFLSH
jgi:hypothetical protein